MPSFLRTIAIAAPVVIIIVVGIGALVVWSRQSDRFPVRVVEVRPGLKEIQEEEVSSKVSPFLKDGFFWINVRSVQDSLQGLPWAQAVEVRRMWPDRLVIAVQEKTAQARWGENGLLSTEGVIFYPECDAIPRNLPQLTGPDDRAKEMLQQYLTMLEVLAPIGLTVQQLQLSSDGSWRIVLGNGLAIIIGKAGVNERMARLVLSYPGNLHNQRQQIDYVDLRYTNGFAIGWRF